MDTRYDLKELQKVHNITCLEAVVDGMDKCIRITNEYLSSGITHLRGLDLEYVKVSCQRIRSETLSLIRMF